MSYPRIWVRYVTLAIMCLCSFIALAIVFVTACASDLAGSLRYPSVARREITEWLHSPADWTWAAGVALVFPGIVLPLLAWLFHFLDERCGGGGIKNRFRRAKRPKFIVNADVIGASMTKQSVLAAIAAIFLTDAEKGSFTSDVFPENAMALSRIGLSVAMLLLIISVLSYDYANRFNLAETERYELLRRGLRLDAFAWYVLAASYIIGIAARNILVSILISILTGLLTWWYYFVETEDEAKARRNRRQANQTVASAERSDG